MSSKRAVPRKPGDNNVDRRRQAPRWCAHRESVIREHLGGSPTVVQESLTRRYVFVEMLALDTERKIIEGKRVEVGPYLALVDRLHSLGRSLGLERRAQTVKSLREVLLEHQSTTEPPA